MANSYPEARPLADKYLPGGQLADVSTASIAYAPVPAQGVIVDALATISAAITSADAVVTVKVIRSGTTTTIGTITIANSGSAPGSTFAAVLTGSEMARSVKRGDTLAFDSDGASSTTATATFLAVIREL